MTPEPGKVIAGKYRLVKPLASGGMGAVWVACHTSLDAEVAVKLMASALAEHTIAQARFEREAKAAARLKSPHVVQVQDFGIEDGTPYMVMELLHGEDLGTTLERQHRLSPARAAAVFAQACKGVRAAHDAGIVHRDIKPSNIFLAKMAGDEVVKILDFGIARAGEPDASGQKTASGVLIGTPHFMSPEQARGAEAGPATDLWSLAVVLYLALSGKRPFDGDSMGEILASILRDQPPPLSAAAPGLPTSFDAFFAKALAREPTARFASATALSDAFAALVAEPNALTVSDSSGGRAGTPASFDAPTLDAAIGPATPGGGLPRGSIRVTPSDGPTKPPTRRDAAHPDAPTLPAEASRTSKSPSSSAPSSNGPSSNGPAPEKPASLADRTPPTGSFDKPPSRSWIGTALVGLVAVVALVLAMKGIKPPDDSGSGQATSASAPSAAAPRPTAITDLPPPSTDKPEALTHYSAALQAIRDANWERAAERLEKATALDPSFAAAHFRLALIRSNSDRPAARKSYTIAADGRARLGERDRAFLEAMGPMFQEPPDEEVVHGLLAKLAERYPLDAEIQLLRGMIEPDVEKSLAGARRSVELDPAFADGWQSVGSALFSLKRYEEAVAPLDRCLAISPMSTDCLGQRAAVYQALGRCADAETDLRQAVTYAPGAAYLQDQRVDALLWMNVAPEALLEAYRRKWMAVPEAERPGIEGADRIRVSLYSGQFDSLEAQFEAIRKFTDRDVSLASFEFRTDSLLLAAIETDRPKDAARLAEAFAKRLEGEALPRQYPIPAMLRAMRRGGALSKTAYRAKLTAFLAAGAELGKAKPWDTWVLWFARGVQTKEEAEEALAAMPAGAQTRPHTLSADAEVGRVMVLAGRAAEAVAAFRRAKEKCNSELSSPPIQLTYGLALEQTGDKQGACSAYANVLSRWGDAKPRSITAETARAKSAALRCPK